MELDFFQRTFNPLSRLKIEKRSQKLDHRDELVKSTVNVKGQSLSIKDFRFAKAYYQSSQHYFITRQYSDSAKTSKKSYKRKAKNFNWVQRP